MSKCSKYVNSIEIEIPRIFLPTFLIHLKIKACKGKIKLQVFILALDISYNMLVIYVHIWHEIYTCNSRINTNT